MTVDADGPGGLPAPAADWPRRCAIVGAGAVGGVVAAALPDGTTCSVLARGATLAALQAGPWRVEAPDGQVRHVRVQAADNPDLLGPQDLVVLAVKAPSVPSVADAVDRLCGPTTRVLVAMNGLPWWFLEGVDGPLRGQRLACIDPDGRLARALPADRIVGGVVHWSSHVPQPGRVHRTSGRGLILGNAMGPADATVHRLAQALAHGGLETSVSDQIQRDVWFKLWGNMTMNPLSALTGATCDRLLDDPLITAFCHAVMLEARELGERLGLPIEQSPQQRCEVTRRLGAFKTSMLQDLEGQRPMEVEALLGSVHEIARRLGRPTPSIDALYGLVRMLARTRGLLGSEAGAPG